MRYKKPGLLFSIFIIAVCISGCASLQESVATGDFNQVIKEKDAKIRSLQEIIDDQQGQLRQLSDTLAACEAQE